MFTAPAFFCPTDLKELKPLLFVAFVATLANSNQQQPKATNSNAQ